MTANHEGPLRVALIGYGLGGSGFHAPVIGAVEGLEATMIVTADPDRSEAARTRWPAAEVVPDVEAVWARADALDLVVLATPNRTHLPLGLAALEVGLHVVVDKPLAATADDGRRLIQAADRHGRILTVYQNRRWDGDFLTLRRLIEAGALGDVYRLESRFERWRPVPKPGWRQDPAPEEAGGLLYDLGAHLIDQTLVLFGPVRDLYAEIDRRRDGARVDDDVFLALTHDGGVRSHLWMNAIAGRRLPRFRALGSRAAWTKEGLDVQERQLRGGGGPSDPGYGEEPRSAWGVLDDGQQSRPIPTEAGRYAEFYAALARAIREGGPPPVDPVDAVEVLEIIEAARSSTAGSTGSGGVIP